MFTIYFNDQKPMYEQLYQFIKIEIKNGQLKPFEKMPSKRKLAAHLKISPVTVEAAYFQLVAEGYLYTIPKSGYYVEENIQPQLAHPVNNPQITYPKKETYEVDFKTNVIDTTLFPKTTWAKLGREVLSENNYELLNVTHPQGLYVLREAIAQYLFNYRGIKASPEQIIVGAGSEVSVGLLIQLLGQNNLYALENPGYSKIYHIFQSNNAKTVPISLDDQGLKVTELTKSEANIVHITPSHQFPTGVIMPIKRRMELLKWAYEQENRYIIEDDYDSEFRFNGQPIPALQGLDYYQKVIYINSFTKTLAPSLRINYIVLPISLLNKYISSFQFHSCSVPNFEQYTLYKFMNGGFFERHLNQMRKAYKLKLELLLDSFNQSNLHKVIEIKGYDAGLHFLITVNTKYTEIELVQRAKEVGVRVYGLSEYYHYANNKNDAKTIVIGYSALTSSEIQIAIERLERIWLK